MPDTSQIMEKFIEKQQYLIVWKQWRNLLIIFLCLLNQFWMRVLHLLLPAALFFGVALASCSHSTSAPSMDTTHTDTTHHDTTHHDTTTHDTTKVPPHDSLLIATYNGSWITDTDFTAMTTGKITDAGLEEASGIAASTHYPNMLWTHNDSGNPNDIFLIDSTGTIRGRWFISNGSNRDWEDICIGPGPVAGVHYIYLGDIGD